MSGNAQWLERSRAALWHPCTQMKVHETLPIVPIARGEGAWLVDFDGRRYLDAVSSWWVNLFGHAHPRINAALVAQLAGLEITDGVDPARMPSMLAGVQASCPPRPLCRSARPCSCPPCPTPSAGWPTACR